MLAIPLFLSDLLDLKILFDQFLVLWCIVSQLNKKKYLVQTEN